LPAAGRIEAPPGAPPLVKQPPLPTTIFGSRVISGPERIDAPPPAPVFVRPGGNNNNLRFAGRDLPGPMRAGVPTNVVAGNPPPLAERGLPGPARTGVPTNIVGNIPALTERALPGPARTDTRTNFALGNLPSFAERRLPGAGRVDPQIHSPAFVTRENPTHLGARVIPGNGPGARPVHIGSPPPAEGNPLATGAIPATERFALRDLPGGRADRMPPAVAEKPEAPGSLATVNVPGARAPEAEAPPPASLATTEIPGSRREPPPSVNPLAGRPIQAPDQTASTTNPALPAPAATLGQPGGSPLGQSPVVPGGRKAPIPDKAEEQRAASLHSKAMPAPSMNA
jgi:hypothetical protein